MDQKQPTPSLFSFIKLLKEKISDFKSKKKKLEVETFNEGDIVYHKLTGEVYIIDSVGTKESTVETHTYNKLIIKNSKLAKKDDLFR